METSGILGITALVISVVGTIVAAVNHKKLVSKCCGKRVEMSLDISETTPSPSIKPKLPAIVAPTETSHKPESP